MIGIKIGLIGSVLFITGYLAFPRHNKKGVGYLKYLLNGVVISITSFIMLILTLYLIDSLKASLFVHPKDLKEIALFYELIPASWFPDFSTTITHAIYKHLWLLMLFLLFNISIAFLLSRYRKNQIIIDEEDFVIARNGNVTVAGRINKIKIGKDETASRFVIHGKYNKVDEEYHEQNSSSLVECSEIIERFDEEADFRIKYQSIIKSVLNTDVESVSVSIKSKNDETIVYQTGEKMIKLSGTGNYYYGYCEMRGIEKGALITISSHLFSNTLRRKINKDLVINWEIPASFYDIKTGKKALKGAFSGKEWNTIFENPEQSFEELYQDIQKIKDNDTVFPIHDDGHLLIFARISSFRCLEIRLLWHKDSITEKLLQNE